MQKWRPAAKNRPVAEYFCDRLCLFPPLPRSPTADTLSTLALEVLWTYQVLWYCDSFIHFKLNSDVREDASVHSTCVNIWHNCLCLLIDNYNYSCGYIFKRKRIKCGVVGSLWGISWTTGMFIVFVALSTYCIVTAATVLCYKLKNLLTTGGKVRTALGLWREPHAPWCFKADATPAKTTWSLTLAAKNKYGNLIILFLAFLAAPGMFSDCEH